MIPLDDPDIERRRPPVLTAGLIAANVGVFLYQLTLNQIESAAFVYKFGAIPAEVLGNLNVVSIPVYIGPHVRSIDATSPVPNWATMFSSMFIHGGFLHLGGNMLYLWVFGKSIEDRFGHLAFIVFFCRRRDHRRFGPVLGRRHQHDPYGRGQWGYCGCAGRISPALSLQHGEDFADHGVHHSCAYPGSRSSRIAGCTTVF